MCYFPTFVGPVILLKNLSISSSASTECTATTSILFISHWVLEGVKAISAIINPRMVVRNQL